MSRSPPLVASLACALLTSAVAASPARAQAPTLQYTPPPGFIGGQGQADPRIFVDSMVEGSVEVTGFRPFRGDFRAAALQTLFADRMSPEFGRPTILSRPSAQPVTIPGADDAMAVTFSATESFYTYFHMRIAILARGHVAVVDARARSAERLKADLPAVAKTIESLKVVAGAAGPATGKPPVAAVGAPSSRMRELAGLYVGSRMMFQANPFGGVGSGTWVPGSYWYLLSPEGRVQRGYRMPQAPGGDISRFDYDQARREAPADGGSYTVQGAHITFVMGSDTVVADIAPDGSLSINGSPFRRSNPPSR